MHGVAPEAGGDRAWDSRRACLTVMSAKRQFAMRLRHLQVVVSQILMNAESLISSVMDLKA
jgi:hypothetical protein